MLFWHRAAPIILAFSAGALAFALIAQYGFQYAPCELCLMQRVPFALSILFSAIATFRPKSRAVPVLLALCGVSFLIGFGLAIFHTGVERHWWLGTSGCHIAPLRSNSVSGLTAELMNMGVAHCDEISWSLFGLSMTNYNIALSLCLALFSFNAAKKRSP